MPSKNIFYMLNLYDYKNILVISAMIIIHYIIKYFVFVNIDITILTKCLTIQDIYIYNYEQVMLMQV